MFGHHVQDILNKMKIKSVKLVSILGAQIDASLEKSNNTISVSHLNAGSYFLTVTTDADEVIVTRFIKK